jgi:hypothetical protein
MSCCRTSSVSTCGRGRPVNHVTKNIGPVGKNAIHSHCQQRQHLRAIVHDVRMDEKTPGVRSLNYGQRHVTRDRANAGSICARLIQQAHDAGWCHRRKKLYQW